MSLKFNFRRFTALIAVLLAPTFTVLAAPVAEIAETKGAVSVIKATGKRLVVSPQSMLDEGDIVVTEANSTAVLAFTDGGKAALRPNTRFGIERYRYATNEPAKDAGVFKLLAGGLRTLTGAIGKRGDRDAYQMKAETATIGIRGTEYTARLCKGECGEATAQKSVPAARLTGLKGQVTVTSSTGNKRPASDGMALQVGDQVDTGEESWSGIVFSDNSRVVLRARSAMVIKHYRYEPAKPNEGNFAANLLKGGLRALTGNIAKRTPDQVKFEMATATIGIRGTGFSAWCVAMGSYKPEQSGGAGATTSCGQALLTEVSEGRIAVTNPSGTTEVGVGQTAYVDGPTALPGLLTVPIQLPLEDGAPSPATLPLFDAIPAAAADGEGLFVLVHDGRIALTQGGQSIEVGKGESAFAGADGTTLQQLDSAPDFLSRDPMLKSINFDAVSCTLP